MSSINSSSHSRPWGLIILCSVPNTAVFRFPRINNLLLQSSVQSLSCVWFFVTPWTAVRQASLSITSSQSFFKLMSIESVRPSNHLILCRPLLLPPSIFPSIRVFSNESVLCIRWPKCQVSKPSYASYNLKSFRNSRNSTTDNKLRTLAT